MPLTPLHLAVGLPVKKHISMKSFVVVNLMIDVEPISVAFFNLPGNLHQAVHTLGGVTLMAVVTLLIGLAFRGEYRKWLYGAFLGAWSHVLLDSLVHHDVEPFAPLFNGNPLYLDAHQEVSILCAVVIAYYLAKWVESLRIGEVLTRLRENIRGRFKPSILGD